MNLIDNARHWHRMWSNRLAVLAGAVFAALIADPNLLRQFVELVPEAWRPLAAALGGLAVSSAAIGSRMVKQSKLTGGE